MLKKVLWFFFPFRIHVLEMDGDFSRSGGLQAGIEYITVSTFHQDHHEWCVSHDDQACTNLNFGSQNT